MVPIDTSKSELLFLKEEVTKEQSINFEENDRFCIMPMVIIWALKLDLIRHENKEDIYISNSI